MSDHSTSEQKPIFIATQNDEGQRVDNYLLKQCKQLNKASCYKLIRKGQIRINGKRIKPMQKLVAKDQIRVPPFVYFVDKKTVDVPKINQQQLLQQILFEDASYLVLNKPAGLPCHTGTGHDLGVIEIMNSLPMYSNLQLAHRLDKDTSGCLLLAKNRQALLLFQQALKQHEAKKTYIAILTGILVKPTEVNQPLDTANRVNGIRHVKVSPSGKSAVTLFTPIKNVKNMSLVTCEIDTGRTHQIRVHAKFLGMPVRGDQLYGKPLNTLPRALYLHAEKLSFADIEVRAPVPKSFDLNE